MPLPKQRPRTSSSGIFDVRNYGATGDGKTLDTDAVNRAIEAAAAAAAAWLSSPPAMYLCFSIRLKSHVHLHLEQGSAIVAADSPKPGETTGYNGGVYDAAEPKTEWDAYQDYGHNHWHNSLLWGEDIHDFSITGTGLIYGKGSASAPAPDALPKHRAAAASVPSPPPAIQPTRLPLPPACPPAATTPCIRPSSPASATRPSRSRTAATSCFRDFSILKGGHFALLLTGVDNLTIDNLKIDTDRDGMDIDCCQNVRVSNCTVNSPWDDGICPKSSYALGYARPTRNVTITNCFVTGYYQLGTVLDGTYKKFPPSAARLRNRPHQVRHRIERRLHQHHHLQLRLRRLPGLRARNRRRRAA